MAIRHSITLSTSEPNNEVGNLKIRQGDEQTQTLVANITENGVPKPFTGLQPFFCAKLGQTAGLGIIEQKVTGTMNPANGTLEYVMQPEDWQQLGRQTAYFSFRKMVNDHEWTEQFSTRDFNYNVTKSAFSEGLREVNKAGSTYVWTIEDMLRLFDEYIASGKTDWEEFVEQNREILESVDPGGIVLRELLDARRPFGGEAYPTLGERLDEEKAEVSAQLAQTEIDLKQRGVNIFQFKEHVPNAIMQPNHNDWDWTEALRQAIEYCRVNMIHKIIAPEGLYRILDDIDLTTVPLLEIEGITNGQLYPGKGAKSIFFFENCNVGFDTGRNPYVTLKNLELNGTETTNIVLNFGFFTRLVNVSITGGVVAGGKITTGQNSTFINTSFSGNVGDGLILEDILTTTLTFITCYFRENGGRGISGETSDAYFLRCTFESNIGKAIHLTEAKKLLKFESCYWEANEMPNGVHVQIENGEAQFENCDFGSTQIVRVANLINSEVEFRNSKQAGGPDTPSLNFDIDSKVILYNSFEHHPVDNRVIRPRVVNEKTGRESWSVVDSPSVIDVVIEGSVPLVDYEVYVTVSCTQELTYTISDRWQEGFKINIHKKPTSANAVFIWKVVY